MEKFRLRKGGIAALALGAFSIILPATASCASITFSTSANPGIGGDANNSFSFTGANVSLTASPGVTFENATNLTNSFGEFTDIQPGAGANSNVVNVDVNSSATVGAVDFKGKISSVVLGNVTAYEISFSSTPGAVAGTGSYAGYTELINNGVTYAIKTTQQLNTNLGGGKTTYLAGFVAGVPLGAAPEPASIATVGLALGLAFFGLRRRKSN